MTVTEEMENYIRGLGDFNQNFEIQRNGATLDFFVRAGRENPWMTPRNINFDYDDNSARISYSADNINYVCSANISDETPLNFEMGQIFLVRNRNNIPLPILKILVFIMGFSTIYSSARGFELVSRNQGTRTHMGLQINFSIQEEPS